MGRSRKSVVQWRGADIIVHRNEEEQRLEALHHPFTAPRTQDIANGGDIRTALAQAYDLVLNGTEVGGGL